MGNILVTGGAGFIGSYVTKELLDKGKKVIIVDNLQPKGGLAYVNPKAEFIEGDITEPSLYKNLDNYGFEGVYHLAAQTSGEDSYKDPKSDILTNSYGTWLIANYCKEREIPRLIYTSTSAVYGSACKDIVDEETQVQPDSIYGVSKHAGELFLKQLLNESETKYTIFRLTNNYGPGENLNYRKKGMVSIYCSYAWRKEPIHIKGSLDRFRDFLFVEDSVEALIDVYDEEKTYNETYILSSGEKIYVRDLVSKVIAHSGKDIGFFVSVSEETPGDTLGFHADISKIRRDLGWEPRHSLDEGLRKYFEWIKKVPVVDDISSYHPFLIN